MKHIYKDYDIVRDGGCFRSERMRGELDANRPLWFYTHTLSQAKEVIDSLED